ncbi:putative WRKY transcription factor 70 [Bidens hawaiensis]|uniref:putative WRKY transcription factor 70 n=1 Tax=Bidens hawaiensis TaxID=980011 RepID=UPI00404A6E76
MEETSTPNMKRLISELIKGRDCTKQLQYLLMHPRVVDDIDETVSADDLMIKIIGSFSDNLSMLSSWETANYASSSGERGKKKSPAVKERRGCYKRRKTEDSRVTIAKTHEDGFAWRKYGQKDIQHAKFPRCYYRCTHKDEGCGALKHVQELEGESELFRITYIGSHTCQNVNKNEQMFSDSQDLGLFLINFEDSRIEHSPSSHSTITNFQTISSFHQENSSKAQNSDYVASSHDTSSMYFWEGMLANIEDSGFKHSPSSLSTTTNFPTTSSLNKENDSKAQSGDYLVSGYDTSSMHEWEDILAILELSYDDIFKDDDDVKF